MKNVIHILLLLTFIGCHQTDNRATESIPVVETETLEVLSEPTQESQKENNILKKESSNCSARNFTNLKHEELQSAFFKQLNSVRTSQYPNNDQLVNIMVDLTPEYLNQFLKDLKIDSLEQNNYFVKEYHFKIAPPEYTDPEICKDQIIVSYDSIACAFTLLINNTFLVQPDWCAESSVIYTFRINGNRISYFRRQEAG